MSHVVHNQRCNFDKLDELAYVDPEDDYRSLQSISNLRLTTFNAFSSKHHTIGETSVYFHHYIRTVIIPKNVFKKFDCM